MRQGGSPEFGGITGMAPTHQCSRKSVDKLAHGVLAAVFALLGVTAASAGEESPAGFSCKFASGYSWSHEAGKFQSSAPTALAFEVTGIDLEGQSATLMQEGKVAGKLRVIRALNANHFLEVANEGFLNLTTIYDLDSVSGTYPAVHSRHFGLLGQPVFAQYAGHCTAK